MSSRYSAFDFTGYDISLEMLLQANKRYEQSECKWISTFPENVKYDYVTASGIFNVKLDNSDAIWKDYITETIHKMNTVSAKGFSFNILTKYSDKEFMKDKLYYADPCYWFDYCKQHFSKNVALLHDYSLYEFTILVKRF